MIVIITDHKYLWFIEPLGFPGRAPLGPLGTPWDPLGSLGPGFPWCPSNGTGFPRVQQALCCVALLGASSGQVQNRFAAVLGSWSHFDRKEDIKGLWTWRKRWWEELATKFKSRRPDMRHTSQTLPLLVTWLGINHRFLLVFIVFLVFFSVF